MRTINHKTRIGSLFSHRSIVILIVLLLGVLVVACGSTAATPESNSAPPPAEQTNTIAPSTVELTETISPPTIEPTDTVAPPTIDPTTAECTPIGGDTDPQLCVASVSVQINNGEPKPVGYEGHLLLQAGDVIRLVDLRYCSSEANSDDSVSSEVYLFENRVESYDKGLFTRGGPHIRNGCGVVGDFEGSWTVTAGEHRVVVALVHYFGDNYEVDDRFFINLDVGP